MKTTELLPILHKDPGVRNISIIEEFYTHYYAQYYRSDTVLDISQYRDFILDFKFIDRYIKKLCADHLEHISPIIKIINGKFVHAAILYLFEIVILVRVCGANLQKVTKGSHKYYFAHVLSNFVEMHYDWETLDINDLIAVYALLVPFEYQPELTRAIRSGYNNFRRSDRSFSDMLQNVSFQFIEVSVNYANLVFDQ